MEDTEGKILFGADASVLVLFGTLIFGGVVILLGYIVNRYSRSHGDMDSTKDATESEKNKGEESRDSVSGSITSMGGNKRAKNKKRREPQQEFTHSWMVGALKGHTSNVFDMNFSSNGKLLASCGEDGLRPEEEVLDPGETNRYGSEKVNDLNDLNDLNELNELNNHREGATSKSSSSSSSSGNSKTSTGCSSSSSSATTSPALSPTLSTKEDRAILSRRQRKNRTRTPRERREDDREECCEQQSANSQHRMQQQSQTSRRQSQQRQGVQQQLQSNSSGGSSSSNHHQQQQQQQQQVSQQSRQRRSHYSRPSRGSGNASSSSSMRLTPSKSNVSSRRKQNSGESRRDDKNCTDGSPSTSSNGNILGGRKSRNALPSRQREELHHLSDAALASLLRRYTLTGEQLAHLGYPVECSFFPGYAVIINHQQHPMGHRARVYQHLDANAQEFVPSGGNDVAGTSVAESEADSGNGSGSSVESSDLEQESSSDSDKSSDILESSSSSSSSSSSCTSSSYYEEQSTTSRRDSTPDPCSFSVVERRCARCYKSFYTNRKDGEYLHEERCVYHWGKLRSGLVNGSHYDVWECCGTREGARGCTTARMHVWTGLAPGYNGPFDGYVRTRPARTVPKDGNYGVYALDCEMCFTRRGLELAKVTVVGVDGKVVYDALVKPDAEVIDHNTRFSGITAKDLAKATKTLRDVQKDITSFVHAETILIGHGLENDLRALRMLHTTVIDTCVAFPHFLGYPFRSSLKTLARTVLRREIQVTEHDSVEDARIAVDLMLRRLQHDLL